MNRPVRARRKGASLSEREQEEDDPHAQDIGVENDGEDHTKKRALVRTASSWSRLKRKGSPTS